MVFSVIFIGVGYGLIASVRLTADSRARVVASNIASGQIDAAQAAGDPFSLFDAVGTETVDGTVYTWERSTGWVTATGSNTDCGIGGGSLQYKRVNVAVTWQGKIGVSSPVRLDTILAPTSRINDPSYGSILVRVLAADGTGVPNIPVTITATSGGSAATAASTDADGCSYALKVTAGTYAVKVHKANYVSDAQVANPSMSVVVAAGSTLSAPFQYDSAGRFDLKYAANQVATRVLPTALDTSFFSTYGQYATTGTAPSVNLHPFSSGYSVVAGKYVKPVVSTTGVATAGCVSPDPSAWPAGTVNGVALRAGVRAAPVAAAPGEPVTMPIAMGVVSAPLTGATTFVATSTAPVAGNGDPGCAVPMTYTFPAIGSGTTVDTALLALPYGTWTLYKKSSTGTLTIATGLTGTTVAPNGSFTLDPRLP